MVWQMHRLPANVLEVAAYRPPVPGCLQSIAAAQPKTRPLHVQDLHLLLSADSLVLYNLSPLMNCLFDVTNLLLKISIRIATTGPRQRSPYTRGSKLVPGVGLEPTLHYWKGILSPQRLPIPPSGHVI